MSRYDRYSESALGVLVRSQDIALRGASSETGYKDLAQAFMLADLADIVAIARRNNAVVDQASLKALNERIEAEPTREPSGPLKISQEFRGILDKAEALAGDAKVEPSHLLAAAWPTIKDEIAPYLRSELAPGLIIPSDDITLPELAPAPKLSEADIVLARFGSELTAPDAEFPVYGREAEIDSLVSVLLKYWKPNPLIVGDSGVGKTALVQGLAMRIKSGAVPERLKGARIFEVRVSDLLSGTTLHGALEENLSMLVEAAESMDNAFLFIDEMHQIVPAFANNPISEVLKPALSAGRVRCIGATTSADYARYLEKDSALLRRFQTVLVKEPDDGALARIVEGVSPRLEEHFGVRIPAPVRARAVEVARRYLPMRRFPDKALDVLDRAASKALFAGERELTEARLLDAVRDIAKVVADPGLDEHSGYAGLESALGSRIKGQDEAIRQVCEAVRVAKMRLEPRGHRPDGAFLFTGPTGVGKTALAERLAAALSGREDALFRIDMSEFSDAHTAARLLGAPPGYIGYDEAPLLSKAVESCAGGVLLLDELEKAHPQVHRLFLQILDAGRATDSTGKVLSFSSLTIIATCNVGSDSGPTVGFDAGEGRPSGERVPLSALKKAFPVELLNRFDSIVPFRALDEADARRIVSELVVRDANANLGREYGLSLSLSEQAMDIVVRQGFSREFGARDLYRAFRRLVSVPLSRLLPALRSGSDAEQSDAVRAHAVRADAADDGESLAFSRG